MVAMALALLAIRFYLRLVRQKSRPHASDYISLFTFLVIVMEGVIGTVFNVDEMRYLKTHPTYPRDVDVMFGYSAARRIHYLKVFFPPPPTYSKNG